MKVVALVVQWHTPDLVALCRASLARFAPQVEIRVVNGGPGAHFHAQRITEFQRACQDRLMSSPDVVVLLDPDTCILSEAWYPAMTEPIAAGMVAVGGLRSRGDASQLFEGAHPILHASCLAIATPWFVDVPSFTAEWDPVTEFYQRDTAAQVSLGANPYHLQVWPFRRVGHGPLFDGLQVGEYFDPQTDQSLWAHAWRGTIARTRGLYAYWWRFKHLLGSPHAEGIVRAQRRHQAFLQRGWQIVGQQRPPDPVDPGHAIGEAG